MIDGDDNNYDNDDNDDDGDDINEENDDDKADMMIIAVGNGDSDNIYIKIMNSP